METIPRNVSRFFVSSTLSTRGFSRVVWTRAENLKRKTSGTQGMSIHDENWNETLQELHFKDEKKNSTDRLDFTSAQLERKMKQTHENCIL